MPITELDTFVRKFHQLWHAGLNAHLHLNCHAGAAHVGLSLDLGHAPGPAHHQADPFPHHRRSPSYQRRRARREAARADSNNTAEVSKDCVVNEENNSDAEIASVTATDFATDCVNEKQENDTKENESVNIEVEAEKAVQENEVDNQEDDVVENETVDKNIEVQEENIEVEKDDEEIEKTLSVQANTIPDIIPVYCVATIENCPDANLNGDYGDSIRRFLTSEQHLAQNIVSTDLEYISCRSFRNNIYTHTVSVVIHVKTARLWESPASYIRKHLGISNYWTRSNGTVVRLSRIHQK